MKEKSTFEQAKEYVNRVGITEAKQSNHYLTAQRHCKCGDCFCCFVYSIVNENLIPPEHNRILTRKNNPI